MIELLVVIGIIVILIAILLPALGGARNQAYKTQTGALMAGLSNNIETYFQTFDAYPGPAAAGGAATNTAVTGASKITGTQNLLVALSYSMWTSSTPSNMPLTFKAVPMPGSTVFVDTANIVGPTDLSTLKAVGQAYFNPNDKEISKPTGGTTSANFTWPAGGVDGAVGANFPFPTIIDRFPDALPILYFRRSASVEGAVTYAANGSMNSGQTLVSEDPATAVRPWYRAENKEYLDATALKSSSGVAYNQSTGSSLSGGTGNDELARLIAPEASGKTINARGGYVLISAGVDRIYGRKKNASGAATGGSDDIVNIGGH
jgi:type II secretory pathway pseudopilin PulG